MTKSKRSLHWCRSISKKNVCAGFITVSVKKLLHYRAGGLLQYRAVLLHYRAAITLSGFFYYNIGQVLQYRAFITLSVGTASLVSSFPAHVTLPLSSVVCHPPSFLRVQPALICSSPVSLSNSSALHHSSPVCPRHSCYFSYPVVFAHLQSLLL